jgi:hypothetical protein
MIAASMTDTPDNTPAKRPIRPRNLWPLLIGPFLGTVAAVANWIAPNTIAFQARTSEKIAIGTAGVIVTVAVTRAFVTRQPLAILLAALGCIVLVREIHIHALDPFVYGSLVALAVWSVLWSGRIKPYLDPRPQERAWLIATAVTYVLSQFIARRGLQHILGVDYPFGEFIDIHQGSIEETVENSAHLMLLATVLLIRHEPPAADAPAA